MEPDTLHMIHPAQLHVTDSKPRLTQRVNATSMLLGRSQQLAVRVKLMLRV